MKKSIIALMGLFTLVACSEDTYQEADKMNETRTGAVENTGPQNSIKTIDALTNYESPYGTTDRFTYVFQNDTDLEFAFTPWFRLCFYDLIHPFNSTVHYGANLTSFPHYSGITPSLLGKYNYYNASSTITMSPFTTETITVAGGMILPCDPAGPKTATGQYFNLQSTFPGFPLITSAEITFFRQHLKFVGLEGQFRDRTTGLSAGAATLRFPFGPQFSGPFAPLSLPPSSWIQVPMFSPTNEVMYYNVASKEICVTDTVMGTVGQRDTLKTFTYKGVTYTLSLYTTQNRVVVLLQ